MNWFKEIPCSAANRSASCLRSVGRLSGYRDMTGTLRAKIGPLTSRATSYQTSDGRQSTAHRSKKNEFQLLENEFRELEFVFLRSEFEFGELEFEFLGSEFVIGEPEFEFLRLEFDFREPEFDFRLLKLTSRQLKFEFLGLWSHGRPRTLSSTSLSLWAKRAASKRLRS